jgi:hypothetical protein
MKGVSDQREKSFLIWEKLLKAKTVNGVGMRLEVKSITKVLEFI